MEAARYQLFLRGLGRAVRLPPRELLTMLRAGAVLVVVEALIRWVRLPRLSALLGVRLNLDPVRADAEPLPASELTPVARRQLRCTRRIADVWPLAKGPCLRRSLVAGHLLRRYDPSIRIGVAGAGDGVHAHAWLEIDGRPLETVSGFNVLQQRPARVTSTP